MYTAVAHVHSTFSFDGKVPLHELAALFRAKGVQVVLMSEHVEPLDVASVRRFIDECAQLSDDSLLLLPGLELEYYNVLAYGITDVPEWDDPRELVEPFRNQGAYLALSHPAKLHASAEEVAFPVVEGVEVWNNKYDGKGALRPASLALYRELAERRPELTPLCGLDFHRTSDYADVTMSLDAAELTRAAVLDALHRGAVRILAGGRPIPIYDDSNAGARALFRVKSAALTCAFDAARHASAGLKKAGIPVPGVVRKFVKKLF